MHDTFLPGKYLYIEASSPRKAKDIARISKHYTGMATGGSCLSFWYHMYGRNIGTLNVYSKATVLHSLGIARWTMVGAQGDQWRKGEFTVLGSSSMVSITESMIIQDKDRQQIFKGKCTIG